MNNMPSPYFDAVFATASFQFCGHIDEYLIRHTRHLGLLYLQTRFGKGGHLFRRYEDGKLVEERRLPSARSIVGYYFFWLWHWHRELSRFCRRRRDVLALFEHPLGGVGMSLRRRARHLFWQWDYFPSGNAIDRLFNEVAGYYARRCDRYIALTSAIGKAMGLPKAKVVMLGVTPPVRFGDPQSNRILMVGQLRHGQGVEDVLDFISANPQYQLSLMGAAANGFEAVINERIAAAKMTDRVYFPNKFVSDMELREEAAKCFVSLALYDTSAGNLTHYADPGKVKSSIEMGLPVVMTRISDIVPFIVRFKAGEVIDSVADLPTAIDLVRRNYTDYQAGLRAFAAHFDTETYYKDALFGGCIRDENLVSYSHANKFEDNLHDERSVRGGIHPFAGSRESVVADFGRVRMLAQEVSAELLRTLQHGERASVREESAALIVAAKRLGMYIPYQERGRFGDLKRRASGESEVYVGSDFSILHKFKDPDAKQPIKHTTPQDWLFEHIVHNVLFPDARYDFVGISDVSGSIRIVLRQDNFNAVSRLSDEQIAEKLNSLGLKADGRYSFGNEVLSVTDVSSTGDNVLLDVDGRIRFIDPLIQLKVPALDALVWLVGDFQ